LRRWLSNRKQYQVACFVEQPEQRSARPILFIDKQGAWHYMEHKYTVRKWSELRNLPVFVPSEGKNVGIIEDLYFKAGTDAVYALKVGTRVDGEWALPVTGISEIEADRISIKNAQMLTRALPPLPGAQNLLGKKVVNEDGNEIGTVGEIYLATSRPEVLHIASIELASTSGNRSSKSRAFNEGEIAGYTEDTIIIYDRAARR
jgi:sporulation protein YlmC with PRC-barrel domain